MTKRITYLGFTIQRDADSGCYFWNDGAGFGDGHFDTVEEARQSIRRHLAAAIDGEVA